MTDGIPRIVAGGARSARRGAPRFTVPPSMLAGAGAFAVLVALYSATAARDLTFWDAPEFITAAQTLGIPHPPGTPLWTLLGNVFARLFSANGPARSVTMLSVVSAAFAGAIGASMVSRWIGVRGAIAAAIAAGTMSTVWFNATETEVYSVALLLSVSMLYAGARAGAGEAGDDERERWRALIAFLAGLALPLHLSALVAVPGAVALAWNGARPRARELVAWGALALLGVSAVALLPLFSARGPALDSGHPVTLRALLAVLRREQFDVSGLWPRMAPLWLQFGNVVQWADWQVGFALHPAPTPSWRRTPLTLVWLVFAAAGLRELWARDRRVGRAIAILVLSATFGVALWLNMRTGPSYGHGVLPAGAIHEARERDYFFALGFWGWGILAGVGIATLAALIGDRLRGSGASRRVAGGATTLAIALAATMPLATNFEAVRRDREPLASLPRVFARGLLDAVPQNGVLLVAGDNDTFLLWYFQQVEDYRPDVSVVTVPLLGASWYRAMLYRRHGLLPESHVRSWRGIDGTLQAIAQRALQSRRELRASNWLPARDRRRVIPTAGWRFEGMVYAPDFTLPAGGTGIDVARTRAARDGIPRWVFDSLPGGIDGIGRQVQEQLACTRLIARDSLLLVSACNGA